MTWKPIKVHFSLWCDIKLLCLCDLFCYRKKDVFPAASPNNSKDKTRKKIKQTRKQID